MDALTLSSKGAESTSLRDIENVLIDLPEGELQENRYG